MPENPDKPYVYDRCAELGVKPIDREELLVLVHSLVERVHALETQLKSLTGAKDAAKPAITT